MQRSADGLCEGRAAGLHAAAKRPIGSAIWLLTALFLLASAPASAGSILYVSDSITDALTIPDVLSGGSAEVAHPNATIAAAGGTFRPASSSERHDVTVIRNDYVTTGGGPFPSPAEGTNPTLAGLTGGVSLSNYDAIFWSASGPHDPDLFSGGLGTDGGLHSDASVFTSLSSYVASGGWVFVTGHDALADPGDQLLIDFVAGGTGTAVSIQYEPAVAAAISSTTSFLTSGVADITGLVPGAVAAGGVAGAGTDPDLDAILGLAGDTVGLVEEASTPGGYLWTMRVPTGDPLDPLVGRIAYVANGIPFIEDLPYDDPPSEPYVLDGQDPSWLNDPAYNGALLNFAAAAVIPEPSTALLLGGGLMGLAWRRRVT